MYDMTQIPQVTIVKEEVPPSDKVYQFVCSNPDAAQLQTFYRKLSTVCLFSELSTFMLKNYFKLALR